MDESSMIERLRVDADRIETDDTDVDALVGGALRQGRRRRTRRRVGAGVTSALVAAGLAAAVLAGGVTSARTGVAVPGPAAPPVTTSSIPATTSASAPPSSPSPSALAGERRVSGSPAQVRTTFADLLPTSLTVTRASAAREAGSNGFAWENNASLTVRDAAGTSYLVGGIGNGPYTDGCFGLKQCEQTVLPHGTLAVSRSPSGDKAGADRTFTYDRLDGGHIWLMERNYAQGNGPVTRTGLPLTEKEAEALVTSTAWDRLFQG